MKTRAVHAKLPIRLMKSPNLGTIMANTAVKMTIRVRRYNRRNGLNLFILGNFCTIFDFSIIWKTGINYIG